MVAKFDGIKHTTVDKLSRFGTNCKHTQNIQRDLLIYMHKYLHPIVQPEADCVKIPLQIIKGEHTGTHILPHYYMAPRKLMSFMYNNFRTACQDKILGQDGAMGECWSNIADDDPRIIKLAKEHPDYKRKCVPIIIHGDGVPCTNNHSLDAISFESILAKMGYGHNLQHIGLHVLYYWGVHTNHGFRE